MIDLLLWDFLSADGTFLPRPQYPCMCVHSLRVVMCVLQAFPLLQFALTKSRVTSNRPRLPTCSVHKYPESSAAASDLLPVIVVSNYWRRRRRVSVHDHIFKLPRPSHWLLCVLITLITLQYTTVPWGIPQYHVVLWLLCCTPLCSEVFLSTMQYSDYCVILWLLWHTPVYSEVFLCVLQYSDYSAILHCILRVFGTLWFLISTLKYATVSWDIPHHFDCYSVL